MPAQNEDFPWMSYYGHYKFFENKINSHSKVLNIESLGDGLYQAEINGYGELKIFICECYSFGLAEYYESIENLGKLDVVIINSNWCNYTLEAKRQCRESRVGLFNIGDFMAAINRDKFWEYLSEREQEYFNNNGWL